MPALTHLELIQSHRWSRLLFTTYSLSLSFFEAVVLDRVLRQQIRSCTVLADVFGIRAAMDEIGSTSAGRNYDLEPVEVKNGCFHPKLLALLSGDEVALAISSGNLTFGGWGSNLECIEYLHPSFAPEAFYDTAEFLESLAESERVTHAAQRECLEVAERLRAGTDKNKKNARLRVLHSLRRSILDQIEELASDLGGASRIVIASPFFDDGAVPRICRKLKVEGAYLHAHEGGTVLGTAGSNWPGSSSGQYSPIRLSQLDEKPTRLLHAKMMEIVCRRGRIVISGSANATTAALGSERNVELCVARVCEHRTPWQFVAAIAPERTVALPDDSLNEEGTEIAAILRATLEGTTLTGRVIGKFPKGDVTAYRRAGLTWKELASTHIDENRKFSLRVPEGWQAFQSGQALLRLRHSSQVIAQGFISLPDLREISQRLGSTAPTFFTFLEGRETPADVAAILDYIYQNPDWLPSNDESAEISSSGEEQAQVDRVVDLDELLNGPHAPRTPQDSNRGTWSGWQTFMRDVFAAFARPGRPLVSTQPATRGPDAEDDEESDEEDERDILATERALGSFKRLLEKILNRPRESRHLEKAVAITQYVSSRLSLEASETLQYLKRILDAFEGETRGREEHNLFAAAAWLWSSQLNGEPARKAIQLRRQLLRAGFESLSDPPDLSSFDGFLQNAGKPSELDSIWRIAASVRVPQEEAQRFWDHPGALSAQDFPLLSQVAEWNLLKRGPSSRIHRLKVFADHCPSTGISLPLAIASRLKQDAAATCNCGKVLLCEEV